MHSNPSVVSGVNSRNGRVQTRGTSHPNLRPPATRRPLELADVTRRCGFTAACRILTALLHRQPCAPQLMLQPHRRRPRKITQHLRQRPMRRQRPRRITRMLQLIHLLRQQTSLSNQRRIRILQPLHRRQRRLQRIPHDRPGRCRRRRRHRSRTIRTLTRPILTRPPSRSSLPILSIRHVNLLARRDA